MRRKISIIFNLCLLAAASPAILLAQVKGELSSVQALSPFSVQSAEAEWRRITPPGEEFSILTPAAPIYIRREEKYSLSKDGEPVLEQRTYSAYANDFVFAIESYRAAQPRKLLEEMNRDNPVQMELEREFVVDGFPVKQYHLANKIHPGRRFVIVTKRHVYKMMMVAKEENNAALARFISSLMLGDKISAPATGQAVNVRDTALFRNAHSPSADSLQEQKQAFSGKDVTRKARIVWRPEPFYTEPARQNQVTGTVVLKGFLGANGQVSITEVTQELPYGLTERAIEAALNIRFFPAEKDERRVPQRIQIEYNFNLY